MMNFSRVSLTFLLGVGLSLLSCDGANFGAGGGATSSKSKDAKKTNSDDLESMEIDSQSGELDPDGFDGDKAIDVENTTDSQGNASTVFDDTDKGIRKEVFKFGIDIEAAMADFVFVIDNSVSMKDILSSTASGFESISNDKVWPDRALVAIMSTMVGNRDNLSATHQGINKYNGIEVEPGFLDFVDKSSIEKFRNSAPNFASRWSIDGCQEKWFKPAEKNSSNVSCFKAHTQSSNSGVGCEPGITAVSQLTDKNKGNQLFRKGSIVNFIFVSDTHDPGCGNADLKNQIPTLDTLKEKISKDNVVAGIKFHALAPAKKCTGEDLHGQSYYSLVEATKGYKQDPCNLNDYSSFIKQMVVEGIKQENAVFVLSKTAKKIISVIVDGKSTKDYDFDQDKGTLVFDNLSANDDHKIEVTYQY